MNNFDGPTRADLEARKTEIKTRMNALISNAENRASRALTPDETSEFDCLTESAERVNNALDKLTRSDERAAAFAANGVYSPAVVQRESGPYTPTSAANGGPSFFRDMAHAQRGNFTAIERLNRNNAHTAAYSTRTSTPLNATNGTGGEFIPPLWLEDQFVEFLRPGRPAWELTTQQELPPGTDVLNIPKVGSGTSVDIQGTQNAAITEVDLTTTSVSSSVVTIAGGQTVSMQLVDQSPVNIDRVVLEDLARAYAVKCDSLLLTGSGTGGQPTGVLSTTGVNAITFTSATPKFIDGTTAANSFYNQLVNAINAVRVNRFASPNAIVMHPRRWSWALEALDTANRPVVLTEDTGPFNAGGTAAMGTPAQGRVGTILGLPVYVDPTMPTNTGAGTNQDPVIVARMDDVWTWEGSVKAEAFPQTFAQNLSMFFRLYNYVSIQAARLPVGISVINGTGLVAPAL